ncbi:hypothetical protein DPEC_G00149890 [Dallia pectoralis]|uniref:Uncharacterized protein n=1 Tax=Dallia pectoralis TaxID=75939 RepID=A0ACC2GIY6_DALPE|nr:hypothetical protein DPEC_G00149890 [Dallia pectoralis]
MGNKLLFVAPAQSNEQGQQHHSKQVPTEDSRCHGSDQFDNHPITACYFTGTDPLGQRRPHVIQSMQTEPRNASVP